ncbi:glycoside hydrolase family 25 protein [Bacteroidaceae bacterium HV4-6-C5C]|jgi:Lyzozyme M1 (1,4-beta-N-acetylmuramidase)|nr:glycoside hydrolase family 25 protein [Bacteroidaceae bacterium HV4-6-C5C]
MVAQKGRTKPRKSATPRKKTTRSSKKHRERVMPVWLRNIIALFIIAFFSVAFYWFFVRPYAYRWRPCNGIKAYGVCMPMDYEVHGIDVSHHQGFINWDQLCNNKNLNFPIQFIFIKATEGGDHSDFAFQHNFREARRHGFIRGAYHYFNPKTDPLRQADFFIRTVPLTEGDLPPVLDVEKTGNRSIPQFRMAVKTWLNRVEAHYGVKPILYTSYKFKTKYLDDPAFNTYPYWIAHYYVDSVKYEGHWNFWQHTDVGTVPGIKEDVDLNVFNGSLNELKALALHK